MVRRFVPVLLVLCSILGRPQPAGALIQWVERPDEMEIFALADVDDSGERIRILYQTLPSLEQQKRPEGWKVHVYVAEVAADGTVEQHQVFAKQRRNGSLVLRRGSDEIFVVAAVGASEKQQTLERWSIADGELLASVELPALGQAVGLGFPENRIAPTDDGNFFLLRYPEGTDGSKGITWSKFSADGELLGQGEYRRRNARLVPAGWFAAAGGGVGISMGISKVRADAELETDIDTPIKRTIGGRTLEASVFSETRILVSDDTIAVYGSSPALERSLAWGGQMSVPQSLPYGEMMAQTNEQMRAMEEVVLESGAARRIVHRLDEFFTNSDNIRKAVDGYAMLANLTVARDRTPPVHGSYYVTLDRAGGMSRQVYLEPFAERLGAEFVDFLPTEDGGVLLVGSRTPAGTREYRLHATRVGSDGDLEWFVDLESRDVRLDGIAGSGANPWVFGHGWSNRWKRSLLCVQRVDLADAKRPGDEPMQPSAGSAAAAAAEGEQSAEAASADGNASAPPAASDGPGDGCTCTCEEWNALQERVQAMKSMTDAEKLTLVQDPKWLQQMSCAQRCAMRYLDCQKR